MRLLLSMNGAILGCVAIDLLPLPAAIYRIPPMEPRNGTCTIVKFSARASI